MCTNISISLKYFEHLTNLYSFVIYSAHFVYHEDCNIVLWIKQWIQQLLMTHFCCVEHGYWLLAANHILC